MTTYKELFGKYVQNYASDPTSTDAEGQIWYNTTSGTFKTALGSYGLWSSGGNLNTGRQYLAGAGLQTAGLAFGGAISPADTKSAASESYNGTSWTSTPSMNTARQELAGFGTQTAGLTAGGFTGPATPTSFSEEWTGQALQTKTITVS